MYMRNLATSKYRKYQERKVGNLQKDFLLFLNSVFVSVPFLIL